MPWPPLRSWILNRQVNSGPSSVFICSGEHPTKRWIQNKAWLLLRLGQFYLRLGEWKLRHKILKSRAEPRVPSLCSANMKTQTSSLKLEAVFIPAPRDQLVKFKGRAQAEGHREVIPPNTSFLARYSVIMSREHILIAKLYKTSKEGEVRSQW